MTLLVALAARPVSADPGVDCRVRGACCVIRRYSDDLAGCYPRRLPASVGDGRVGLQLAIMPTGRVELVGATGFDAEVASCMANVLARVRFPANDNGDVTHTFVPITIESLAAK